VPSVQDTTLEMVQLVLPEHANIRGILYGGLMMNWITTAATMAAMKVARGSVVLGSMDDLDFVDAVAIGDVVTLRSWVEYVGTASLEVGVEVHSETPRAGTRRLTTSAHLAMVAVDSVGRPRAVGTSVTPAGPEEEALVGAARARKAERERLLGDRREQALRVAEAEGGGATHALETVRLVFPDEAVFGTLAFAGRLMIHLDEAASLLAVRYCRCPVVTASIDALAFYSPIRIGEIVTFQAALNHVGTTSMEIGVRVLAEHPLKGERRHTCTAYLTMVHLDAQGPKPVPPFTPRTEAERRRWDEAAARRTRRMIRREHLRPAQA
jgi:acyl-CoA hydrolase